MPNDAGRTSDIKQTESLTKKERKIPDLAILPGTYQHAHLYGNTYTEMKLRGGGGRGDGKTLQQLLDEMSITDLKKDRPPGDKNERKRKYEQIRANLSGQFRDMPEDIKNEYKDEYRKNKADYNEGMKAMLDRDLLGMRTGLGKNARDDAEKDVQRSLHNFKKIVDEMKGKEITEDPSQIEQARVKAERLKDAQINIWKGHLNKEEVIALIKKDKVKSSELIKKGESTSSLSSDDYNPRPKKITLDSGITGIFKAFVPDDYLAGRGDRAFGSHLEIAAYQIHEIFKLEMVSLTVEYEINGRNGSFQVWMNDQQGKLGRPVVLPSVILWMAVLVAVLRGLKSQRAIWRLIVAGGWWKQPSYDIEDQAVYKRLEQEGYKPLVQVFERVSQLIVHWLQPALQAYHQRHAPLAPFAKQVVTLDEMYLDQVSRRLPILRHFKKGDVQLLPGKLVALFDVRLQQWRAVQYIASAKENGMKQAYRMLASVKAETTLISRSLIWFVKQKMGYSFYLFIWKQRMLFASFVYWLCFIRSRYASQKLVRRYFVLHYLDKCSKRD